MNVELVEIPMPNGGKGYSIRYFHRGIHAKDAESLLQLKTWQARLADQSWAVPTSPDIELSEYWRVGMGLDWNSPLISIDLYVELPFWLLAPAASYTVCIKGTTLEIDVLQDWVEISARNRHAASHSSAVAYAKLTDELIAGSATNADEARTYHTLRTTLQIKTKALEDAIAAYSDPATRRAQSACLYLQALAYAHVPFVARLINAYQVVSGDSFAFEVTESDLPFWFAQVKEQWIGISLVPYTAFDQYPYFRDFSGARAIFELAKKESLDVALSQEPFPGHLELLDAWSLYYRGKYSEAIRLLATAVEIALERVFSKLLAEKGQSEGQIGKRLETTFNDFDGRLQEYLKTANRRLPGPITSIIPYINGVRYQEELARNRRFRHKVVHEGRRFDRSMDGDMQRAMETTTWLFRWLTKNEDNAPKLRSDLNPIISSLRGRPWFKWSYTADGVVIDNPSKRFETVGGEGAASSGIVEEMRHHQFMTSVDGEKQDLELFVRMFFEYLGVATHDAPRPPDGAICEYERYLVYSREGSRGIPIFLFDLERLPAPGHLHAVASRLLMQGNAPLGGRKPSALSTTKKAHLRAFGRTPLSMTLFFCWRSSAVSLFVPRWTCCW